jgi:hypothetical protein
MDLTLKRRRIRSAGLLTIGLGQAAILCAQPVDSERLNRLRDSVETEVRHVEAESLDAHVPTLKQLGDLRDEVGYLRGRLRRGLPVEERECERLEQQMLTLRQQVPHGEVLRAEHARRVAPVEIRVGVELEARVRRITPFVNRQRRFEAVTQADVTENGRMLIPAGAVLSGVIAPVDASSQQGGPLALSVTLHEIAVEGKTYVLDLRILEFSAPGLDPTSVEYVGDSVVLRADDPVPAGAKIRARVESAIELTADGH